jgi:hypothetical protein
MPRGAGVRVEPSTEIAALGSEVLVGLGPLRAPCPSLAGSPMEFKLKPPKLTIINSAYQLTLFLAIGLSS